MVLIVQLLSVVSKWCSMKISHMTHLQMNADYCASVIFKDSTENKCLFYKSIMNYCRYPDIMNINFFYKTTNYDNLEQVTAICAGQE